MFYLDNVKTSVCMAAYTDKPTDVTVLLRRNVDFVNESRRTRNTCILTNVQVKNISGDFVIEFSRLGEHFVNSAKAHLISRV